MRLRPFDRLTGVAKTVGIDATDGLGLGGENIGKAVAMEERRLELGLRRVVRPHERRAFAARLQPLDLPFLAKLHERTFRLADEQRDDVGMIILL